MRKIVFIALIFAPTVLFAQDTATINKWVKATINIEKRASLSSEQEGMVAKQWGLKENDSAFYALRVKIENDMIRTGTAIFFEHNNRFFLLTARHVVNNDLSTDTNEISNRIILIEDYNTNKRLADNKSHLLMNMGSGPRDSRPYFFSSVEDDLAILDISDKSDFLNTLFNRSYTPIKLTDIDSSNNFNKFDRVIAVGFPITSTKFVRDLSELEMVWHSSILTLPAITTGYIETNNKKENYFECAIAVYHGFSGGPLIRNGKLIGINHSFYKDPKIEGTVKQYFLSNITFTRASLLPELIRILENKQSEHKKLIGY